MHLIQRQAMHNFGLRAVMGALVVLLLCAVQANAGSIDKFVGRYSGTVDVVIKGESKQRDASVEIIADEPGFIVNWMTATRRDDGSVKSKSYSVDFQPTEREDVYGAAMRRNVFGKEVPLDPMKGEPYVWSRIVGDTLTVFSIYVYDDGSYEIQQFDRTVVEGGLELEFSTARNGEVRLELSAFLERDS